MATIDPATDVCAREILDGVPPVVWAMRRHMRGHRKGLSMPQFRALVKVHTQPATTLSAVAEHVGASLPTVSRIVSGLVCRGLLMRQGCIDDRRQMRLSITPQGLEVLKIAWRATRDGLATELSRLSPEQQGTLREAMTILKSTFGAVGLPRDLDVRQESSANAPRSRKFPKPLQT